MNDYKVIQTIYNGYKFRSRLEAKWAVFFDNAGIKYEYEPEGYVTNGTCYLPDFYLPKLDAYVEVKRNSKNVDDDIMKCYKSIEWGSSIKRIIFLSDVPDVKAKDGMWCFPSVYYGCNGKDFGWWQFSDSRNEDDEPCLPCIGSILEREYDSPFSIAFDDENAISHWCCLDDEPLCAIGENKIKENSSFYIHRIKDQKKLYKLEGKGNFYDVIRECDSNVQRMEHPYFFEALNKARQARFEFGEKG